MNLHRSLICIPLNKSWSRSYINSIKDKVYCGYSSMHFYSLSEYIDFTISAAWCGDSAFSEMFEPYWIF